MHTHHTAPQPTRLRPLGNVPRPRPCEASPHARLIVGIWPHGRALLGWHSVGTSLLRRLLVGLRILRHDAVHARRPVRRLLACAPQTSCLRLRPMGSPEALVSAPRMPKACPRLRPASADQPPGRPYRPYRPRLQHVCRPSRGFAEQPSSTTTTIAAPSASGMSRLPSGSSSTGSALSHGQAAASPTWYRIRMRVSDPTAQPCGQA